MGWKTTVKVEGAALKVDQLKRFNKEVWLDMQREVKSAADLVVSEARNNVPSEGLYNSQRGRAGWGQWTAAKGGRPLSFNPSKVKSSIKPAFRSVKRSGFRVVKGQAKIMDPAGAIYTLAGSQNRSGHPFNTNINKQRGGSRGARSFWPRILTPAYYAKGPEASKAIGEAIEKAIADINR